jgi:hypothetical protein
MAATRACLVSLVVALAFLFFFEGTAGVSEQDLRQVRSFLKRVNKAPLRSVKVLAS